MGAQQQPEAAAQRPDGAESPTTQSGPRLPGTLTQLITLLRHDRLVNRHIVIAVLLMAPALVKTAPAGWRVIRYYAGSAS